MTQPEPRSNSMTPDLSGFGLDDAEGAWLDHVRAVTAPASLGCIGPYEIVREIARGGQGVVYEARRSGDVDRIALKRLVAGSLATDSMRRRFERELAVATSLDHPHIVTVFGMELIDGEPLLAMEWIDGAPITTWAESDLGVQRPREEILDVFLKVCDAVHYAHQNGVIHRDLKPTNILVDRRGEPRVLDFGLAKQTNVAGARTVSITGSGQFVGTPAYAAPEQLSDVHVKSDVRADVYALGLVLYQLLTERMPYPTDGALPDVLDHIRYTEPARPSSLNVRLDRDLEAILLKALAKRPPERYQSVEAFATDLRRHLAHEPILARAPRWTDFVRRTYRRHPIASTLGAVAVLSVLAFGVLAGALGVAAIRARQDEAHARHVAEASSGFLQSLLAEADPRHRGGDVKVVSLLEEAAQRVEAELADQPEAAADVLTTIAQTYYSLWMTKRSEPYWRKAGALYRQVYGETHPKVAQTLGSLGIVLSFQDSAEAITCQQEALEIYQTLYGKEHVTVARSVHRLGFALYRGSSPPDYAGAERCFKASLAMKRRLLGETHESVATTLHAYAAMLSRQGRHDESLKLYERALEMKRLVHGHESVEVLECLDDYAMCLVRSGRPEKAETQLRHVVAMTDELLGSGWSAAPLARLALTQRKLDRPKEAQRLYCEALRRYYVMLSAHPQTLPPDVKQFLLKSNEASTEEEAAVLKAELLAVIGKTPTKTHINASTFGRILIGFTLALMDNDDLEAAADVAREAHRVRQDTLPVGHWYIAESQAALGYVLARQGHVQRGSTMLRAALAALETARGADAPATATARAYLDEISHPVGAQTDGDVESQSP